LYLIHHMTLMPVIAAGLLFFKRKKVLVNLVSSCWVVCFLFFIFCFNSASLYLSGS